MKIRIRYEKSAERDEKLLYLADTTLTDGKYFCVYGRTKKDVRDELLEKVRTWLSVETETEDVEI